MKEQGILNYIFSLSKGLPLIIQLMVIPVMIFGYKMMYDAKFRAEMFGVLGNLHSNRIEVKKLLIHPIFISTPFFIRNIRNLSFDSKNKEEIIELMLEKKLLSIQSNLTKFLKDLPDFKEISFSQAMKNLIAEISLEYETKIEESLKNKYGIECGKELFDFVYVKGFLPYSEEHIVALILFVQHLSESKIPLNYKIYSFLNYFHTIVDISIFKAEKMFRDFNGDIDKIINKYKKQ